MYNLNSLISDPTWTLQSATAINDKGQIIGVGHHNGYASAFLLTPVATTAPPSQWTSTSSGDWNVSGNWSTGVPDTAGAEADFFGAITSNQTVYTNVPITAGTISFNNSNTYVITGSSTLTLLATTGSAQIITQSGTQEINLPMYVASNAVFNASAGATLIIANPLTVVAGNHVNTAGAGTVLFESQVTLQTGATITINGSNYMNALTVGPQATATVTTHGSAAVSVLQLDSLSISAGTLDLTNNALIVRNGNLAAVTALVTAGFNSNSGHPWTGTGITSSTAQTNPLTALGVVANTEDGNQLFGNGNLFDGTSPGAGDILVKYTYFGDANLDGQVDGSDYTLIDAGYNSRNSPSPLTGWYNGDFNYDGKIDGSDYTLIDNSFNTQGASLAAEVAADTAQIAGTAAVPEPTSLTLVAVSCATMLRRRRKSCMSFLIRAAVS